MNIKFSFLFILLYFISNLIFADQNGMMSTFADDNFPGWNGVMETSYFEDNLSDGEFNGIRTEIEPQNKIFATGLNGVMDVLDPYTDSKIGEDIIIKKVDAPVVRFQLLYAINEFSIDSKNQKILNDCLDIIKKGQVESLVISGYTDPTGSINYNQKLSKKRADAAAKWLVDNGVSTNKIKTVGAGIDNDSADFNTARRVDILIIVK